MTPTTPRLVPRNGLPVRCRQCRRGYVVEPSPLAHCPQDESQCRRMLELWDVGRQWWPLTLPRVHSQELV
jgi:hypothetical protein